MQLHLRSRWIHPAAAAARAHRPWLPPPHLVTHRSANPPSTAHNTAQRNAKLPPPDGGNDDDDDDDDGQRHVIAYRSVHRRSE